MDGLPTGTVTLLFSDIEGSTLLLSRLGEQYAEALSHQRTLLRAAFARWGGRELGTEGDSFYVVFQSAGDAVGCCRDAQRALAAHSWPQDVPVKIRMGLHTGEPDRHEDTYIGMDVHRAARIAAAAHGGQVVMSDATRQLAAGSLPDDVAVRDLGWHRLKDLPAPERVFQLVIDGLDDDFPPLKSLGARTNLPVPPTELVGREEELEQVRARLFQPGVRLLTLTGPGGTGKTRLALAVAEAVTPRFVDGVFFVALATATDADLMWAAIADAMGITGERQAPDAVVDQLAGRHCLLVLDNLEQLAEASVVVRVLLAAAPQLRVLATSRRPLRLQGEHEHPVPPLTLPQPGGAVGESGAVRLFVQQAVMVRPGFRLTEENSVDVAEICARLDGLPLAIELAASRAKLLTPRALLARLDRRLGLAAGDSDRPARQQTLRDTIAWSYDLLPSDLRRAFQRTGVFAGGCDLDAWTAVAGDGGDASGADDPFQTLAELADYSLVTMAEGPDGEPRVGMLQTIREFALEQLAETSELDLLRRHHAEYYLAFAERIAPQLRGNQQLVWLDLMEAEHDNLRAALTWSLGPHAPQESSAGHDERVAIGLRLVHALSWFWYEHGHAVQGRRWLERAVDLASGQDDADFGRAVHGLGVLLLQQGENAAARTALERSLELWRRLGDRQKVAQELSSLGAAHRVLGDYASARHALEESITIAREIGDDHRLATALSNLTLVEIDVGDTDQAIRLIRQALAIDRKLDDSWGVAVDQGNLAAALLRAGQGRAAQTTLCAVIDDVVRLGDVELLADTLERFSATTATLGAPRRAARLAGAAERVRQMAGMPLPAPDEELLERALGPARAAMGRQEWERERAAGRGLTREEAVALAVQPVEERRDTLRATAGG